ncbi:MAG: arylsulfatase [Hellea sp.]|nr:arylsulfatase [Hellea sp.]
MFGLVACQGKDDAGAKTKAETPAATQDASVPSSDSHAASDFSALVKARPADAEQPNVIIILADDLGWADVGYHGSDIQTPNIDRLADEGMRLERFYATPFCTPTRAALMTGRDPIKLGVAHAVLMAWDNGGVSPEEHFMPESFRDAGYDTAMIGKWHLGHTIEQHTPNARGFDHFYGHFNTDVTYFDHTFAGGHDFQENGDIRDHQDEYATDVHGNQAVRYLENIREKDKPFFMYVPFLAPHSPVQAKEEDIAKYPDRRDTPRAPMKTYAAMVDSMDQAIGEILDTLDEQGIADNTIVLFFTDNGGFYNFGGVNTPLRGGKLETYEGGVRVVSVMRWPDVLPAGTINENVISVLDMLPTLTTAAGVESGHTKSIDGIDRWDAIVGQSTKDRGEPLIFTSNVSEYNKFRYGVLDGQWKLVQIVNHLRRTTTSQTQLFNVWDDPNEKTDLSEKHPDQVERLQAILDARLALHPVGGQFVKIQPHPGWRAPKDYASVVIPADMVLPDMWSGFGDLATQVLQMSYGEKGRIKYE